MLTMLHVLICLLVVLKINSINCSIIPFYNIEDGDYGFIGCKLSTPNNTEPIEFCQIGTPDKKYLTVNKRKFANHRYTTIKTDLDNFYCQIEFKLPLLEEEKGIWSCQLDILGGVSIPIESTDVDSIKRITVYTETDVGETLELKCFSLVYNSCNFVSPMGHQFEGNQTSGVCHITIYNVSSQNLGEWSCIIEGDEKVETKINVKNLDDFSAYYNDVEVDEGSNMKLLCKTALPLAYCRFINPAGTSFHVTPTKSNENMHYLGRGLSEGECGVSIRNASTEHTGTWKCAGYPVNSKNLKVYKNELMAEINVIVDRETSYASSIGIGVGVGLAVLLLIGFIFMKKRRNRRAQNDELQHTLSNEMNEQNLYTFGTI